MAAKTERTSQSPFNVCLDSFSQYHSTPLNKALHYFTIPVMSFAVLGMIWAIPFPHLDFIGPYNGYINWASFAVAFAIYHYYRLSPVHSYGPLLLMLLFSAGIVKLEQAERLQGWPPMWLICGVLFVLSWLVQLAAHKAEGKLPPLSYSFKTVLDGPLWLTWTIFRKVNLKF